MGEQSSAPVRLCLLLVVLQSHSTGCQPVCSCPVIQAECEAAGSLAVLASEPPEESLGFSVICDHFSIPREIVLENSIMILKVEVC